LVEDLAVGLGWQDLSKGKSTARKLADAAARFKEKYGLGWPDTVRMAPSEAAEFKPPPGLKVILDERLRPGCYLIGQAAVRSLEELTARLDNLR